MPNAENQQTPATDTLALCRDCLQPGPRSRRCKHCASPRLVHHPELFDLSIAHVDCDAFYATVEKRDRPELRDRPVIVGGAKRGVVSAACYIARTYGVRSAMPMFKALAACPDAVVIKPDMEKYVRVGRDVRQLMLELTPLVEPLSIDEAFLDLSGTAKLHRRSPAESLAKFALKVEQDLGITISVGLAKTKFMAKIASDLDKPRGFAVIGSEAKAFLADKPVGLIWGVGKKLQAKLVQDGIRTIGEIQGKPLKYMLERYGVIGQRLHDLANAHDLRTINPTRETKSISSETTFDTDLGDRERLDHHLWTLSEKVSRRLKRAQLAGRTITLKLKTSDFRTITRSRTLPEATRLAERIYRTSSPLLAAELGRVQFRLIGVGVSELTDAEDADHGDLLDGATQKYARAEAAIDSLRDKFGVNAVQKGRGLKEPR